MSWNGLKSECPNIMHKLKALIWDCFAKPTSNYILVIVREFYATYGAILNAKRGHVCKSQSMSQIMPPS
ncbi:hypothetical protein RND71_022020 [Anisodus tanguticus]|uniref:Uncharacterized protein n=1 Tax=Anisodus tanguticus TaxID=243964 RepID=A0AAE1RXP5_9SOLA|nr:hypothetical protein RND71_022020 [Anisodus tanguticus]